MVWGTRPRARVHNVGAPDRRVPMNEGCLMAGEDRPARPPQGARTRRRRELQHQVRRSVALTALGTIVPGAGLIRTRYHRFGWVLLTCFVAALMTAAGYVLLKGPVNAVLELAVRPDLLVAASGAAVFGALLWVFSIVLTNRGTEPVDVDGAQRLGLQAFTAVMCLAVALPTVEVVRYSTIQRDVVSIVFDGKGGAAPPGGPTASRPQKNSDDPWKKVPRVNVLLLGSDAGDDRTGVRTDSMIVASIDTRTGNTVLFGIPRNLERVPFPKDNPLYKLYPNGYNCGSECLLNAVWAEAENRKELFKNDPNPGLTTIHGVIQEVTGLRLDYTTVIDLAGLQALVDAMGGVVVDVKERLPIGGRIDSAGRLTGVTGWVEIGKQRLNGYHALWYARSRVLSDDYSRMRRQRCMVGIILDQVNPVMMLAKYPELAKVAKDNIKTDVAAEDLPAWVELVQRMKKGTISSLTFTSRNISPANPDFADIRLMIRTALAPVPAAGSTPTDTATTASTTSPTAPSRSSTRSRTTTPTTTTSTATSTTTSVNPSADVLIDVRDAC